MLTLRPWTMRRLLRQRRGRLAPHAQAILGLRLPRRRAWLLWRRPRRMRPPAAPAAVTLVHRLELLLSATTQWRQFLAFTARFLLASDRGVGAATGRVASPAHRLHRRPAIAGPRRTAPQGGAGSGAGLPSRPLLDPAAGAAPAPAGVRVRWRPASQVIRRSLGDEATFLVARARRSQRVGDLPVAGVTLRPSGRALAPAAWSGAAPAAGSGRFFTANRDPALPAPVVRTRTPRAEADAGPAPLRRSVQLVWRKTERAAAADSFALPSGTGHSVSTGRAGAPGFSTSVAAAARTAGAPSARSQAALVVDASAIDRITYDVLGRIERKLRIERERRGH